MYSLRVSQCEPSVRSRVVCEPFFGMNQYWYRVCSLCAVAAYEDEIHIGKDAEAPIAAELRFELIAEICNPVIEEFYIRTVR